MARLPFEDALNAALDIAAMSPSSHNCQPWAVARLVSSRARRHGASLLGPVPPNDHDATTTDEYLVLASDRRREISALPAHQVEMQVSCGLFWHLLQRALAAQGWVVHNGSATPDIRGVGLPPTWTPLRLAHFRWNGVQDESLEELRTIARRRQTNRGVYSSRPVDPAVLDALAQSGTATGPRIHIHHLHSEDDRNRFADLVARYGDQEFTHAGAWRETHSYIRGNAADAAARGDGFTLTHLFGPLSPAQRLVRRLVLAPATMAVLRRTGFPRLLAGQLATVVRHSPAVVAMSVSRTDETAFDMTTAGEALGKYWLRATDAGVALHPISIVIQHDDVRSTLETEFALPGRAFFVARLGYPKVGFPPSPRRNPRDSCHTL